MPAKFKIVVSDLHLSAGHEAEGNPLEDFGSDQEFVAFLQGITAESDRDNVDVELIVNGDAFEMLQVPHVDVFDPTRIYHHTDYHSSSERDSVRKMAIIVDGHRPFFDTLADFVQFGPPRRQVTFVKGNHDVNLHWAGVQNRIRQAVGATADRAPLLAFEERRISREGIYVEHGNQYAAFTDQIDDMEEPHDHDDPGQLAIPLGSWFVMDVFNEWEREKYWIDGIKPITALIWYALRYDFAFAARAIAALVSRFPGIIKEGVLDVQEPRAGFVRQLEDPGQVAEWAARYETDDAFRTEFNAQVAGVLIPPGADQPAPLSVADAEVRAAQIQAQVNSQLFEMAAKRAVEEDVKLVVFGHTHDAVEEELPNGGLYINSGTWTWRADFSGEDKETWQDLFEHPELFTGDRQLSYVRIDYGEDGEPQGKLRIFEPGEGPPLPPEPPQPEPGPWERLLAWFRGLWDRIRGG